MNEIVTLLLIELGKATIETAIKHVVNEKAIKHVVKKAFESLSKR